MRELTDGLREEKVAIERKFELIKHLSENEIICPECKGLGMEIDDNTFYISSLDFPYKKQTVSYCKHCVNGVQEKCPHCGELMRRSRKCNCQGAQEEQNQKKLENAIQTWNKAKKIKYEDVEFEMLYVENANFFITHTALLRYLCLENIKNPRVYRTMTTKLELDADNVVESSADELYDEAYENIPKELIEELQEALDAWCEKVEDNTTTWFPDMTVAVIIPENSLKETEDKLKKEGEQNA